MKTNGKHEVMARVARQSLVLAALLAVVLSTAGISRAQSSTTSSAAPAVAHARAIKTYAALPMMFEANSGQTDPRVKFLSRAPGYTLFLTDKEAVLSLPAGSPASAAAHAGQHSQKVPGPHLEESETPKLTRAVRLKFAGGSTPMAVTGRDQLPGKTNYFLGNDPRQWRKNVANYKGVEYQGVYPGVDVLFHGNQQRLEYDFVVAPGADPHVIALDVEGAKRMRISPQGDMVLDVGQSELELEKPVVYQEVKGQRREVAGNFALRGPRRIGFALGPYDHSQPLVIDPTLAYSTYLGGNYQDSGTSIAVDSTGNVYVTGFTRSTNFPAVNALQAADNGGTSDAFVAKLNATGSALVYSTYLGGNDADYGYGIAVDSSGNAYVTGSTHSTNFSTVNAIQATDNGANNAFVAKLDPAGSTLVYSTYLGGSHDDYGYGIAVDSSGNAYVTGSASSTNFPTANAFQAACGGGGEGGCPGYTDAFVAKLNPAGSALVYSTYLGGSYTDYGTAIAVDSSGDAYVTGFTASYNIASVPGSTNFPTANPFQATCGGTAEGLGCGDAFVTELNPTGSALVYSTYLGGSTIEDYGYGIAVDSSGNAYVTGATASTDFPTANALQPNSAGDGDAFVTKFNAGGSALVYSTYLGGSGGAFGNGIAVDSSGSAYVTGYTESADFPTTNPLQATLAGSFDAFVTKFDPTGSTLVYSTYLGGSNDDQGNGIAVDASGNAYVTGFTYSTNFPTVDPLQKTNSATYGTAFIAKISQPALTVSPGTIAAGTAGALYSPVTFTATDGQGTVTISESGNLPSGMTFSNGTLSGTPTQTGSYPITITATDSQDDTGSDNLTLVINCPTITVGPDTLASGMVGTAYPAVTFTEAGGVGAIAFSETGLPTGIGMTFAAGVLSGTPTTAESSPITVTATDSNGCSGSVTDTLAINSSTIAPAMISPVPGSMFTGPSVTFTWTAPTGATWYDLWLGSTGVGSNNVYDSGAKTATTVSVTGLPTNGETIYTRLFTAFNGVEVHTDYTYTATAQAALTSPAPGSTLTGPSATFTWSAATGATWYDLWLGTTGAGSNNLYDSGQKTGTSVTATGLPTNGETIYARLFTAFNGAEVHTDYTYTADTQAALTLPAPGSTLTGPSATFTWTAATGATWYDLWLGSTGVGSNNLGGSGATTATSATFGVLPTNGETIYARLFTNFNGVEVHTDYTYTADTQAALTSPAPGSTLAGPSATFTWTAAAGATGYDLWLGTTGVGSNNLYDSGLKTGTSATVTGLPTNGETIYARLFTFFNGVEVHTDYTYTAQ